MNAVRLFDAAHSSEPATKTTMATLNTVRDPYRSATHPLIGMNTARLTRYDVSASFKRQRVLADVGGDRRQRRRDHRRVHVLHEQRAGHDERDEDGASQGKGAGTGSRGCGVTVPVTRMLARLEPKGPVREGRPPRSARRNGYPFGAGWMLSTQCTSSGFSTTGMSRFTTTGSCPLRTSTQESGSSSFALISWCGTYGGT